VVLTVTVKLVVPISVKRFCVGKLATDILHMSVILLSVFVVSVMHIFL